MEPLTKSIDALVPDEFKGSTEFLIDDLANYIGSLKSGQERPQFTNVVIENVLKIIAGAIDERISPDDKGRLTFNGPHEILGIITEEYLELQMAVRSDKSKDVCDELIDIAVGAVLGIASYQEQSRERFGFEKQPEPEEDKPEMRTSHVKRRFRTNDAMGQWFGPLDGLEEGELANKFFTKPEYVLNRLHGGGRVVEEAFIKHPKNELIGDVVVGNVRIIAAVPDSDIDPLSKEQIEKIRESLKKQQPSELVLIDGTQSVVVDHADLSDDFEQMVKDMPTEEELCGQAGVPADMITVEAVINAPDIPSTDIEVIEQKPEPVNETPDSANEVETVTKRRWLNDDKKSSWKVEAELEIMFEAPKAAIGYMIFGENKRIEEAHFDAETDEMIGIPVVIMTEKDI